MPGIKTSIYDGAVCLENAASLDLRGYTGVQVSGAHNRGITSLRVKTVDATTVFSAGDKVVDDSGNPLGTIDSVSSSTNINFKNGIKSAVAGDIYIETAPKFEIVAIQVILATVLNVLQPVNSKWPGTVNPAGGTWAESAVTDFGAYDNGSTAVGQVLADSIGVGVTIEGRWKRAEVGSGECIICYLKASPLQTF